jgi:putative ABC transport system permease protein
VDASAGGPDLLVVVAPVLVAAAVAVLVARVMGPLLALAVGALTRLRGGVVFLGTARAGRQRSAAGVALVALALTVAGGLLSATTEATVRTGTEVAAARATGADLRVSGLGFTDAEEAALARLAGVTDVAAWADPQDARIGGANDQSLQTTVIATQPERLAAVQRDLEVVQSFPPDAARRLAAAVRSSSGSTGSPVPVLVSAGLAPVGGALDLRVLGRRVAASVVGTVPTFAGAPTDAFVVADLAQLRVRTGLVLAPQYLLARVAGAVPSEAAVRTAVPSLSATSSRAQTAQRATSSPVVRAVRAGLPAALGIGAGLAALTAVLSLLLGARERGRFLAHLRALGLSARQSAALVAFEALPVGLAGLVAGLVAGLGLTWLVLPAADLRPLTGSAQAPAVVASAASVLSVAGAFAVVLALAVGVAVVAGRSVSPVEAARTVEAE